MSEFPRILVVDDEDLTRMMVSRVLTDAGFTVDEAQNGQQAVEQCTAGPMPELLLMDVRMPVMNGFDACAAIRSLPHCAHLPILMLTSLDDVTAVDTAFEAGATDFVTKPINWSLLSQRVRYALRSSRVERDLATSQSALGRAQKISRLGQWTLDLRSYECVCSTEMRSFVGISPDGEFGLGEMLSMMSSEDGKALQTYLDEIAAGKVGHEIEIRLESPTVGTRYLFLCGDVVLDHAGKAEAIFGVVQDVTQRHEQAARLEYLANFDTVTSLPNLSRLRERLRLAIQANQHRGPGFALLKVATRASLLENAGGGPEQGTRLLMAAVERIRSHFDDQDAIFSLPGEQFGLLLIGGEREMDAGNAATRLKDAFSRPLAVDALEVMTPIHIGIATCPGDSQDADTLIGQAGVALSRAQSVSESAYQFFTEDIQNRVLKAMDIHVALYRSLGREDFVLFYQPLVDLASNSVVATEVLLRWNRPNFGMQFPDTFIPILEETGLIVEAGAWVLRKACQTARDLPLTMAVNISPRQLQQSNLAALIEQILKETGIDPARLEIEITEQAVIADEKHSIAILNDISRLGVQIALDDYGVGFSSLQRFKNLPLNTLKIDRFFVTNLLKDNFDVAIVRSTIELCHELGIKVVAEGVEDDATMQRLRELGCDIAQGYGICRPKPLHEFNSWLAASQYAPHIPQST